MPQVENKFVRWDKKIHHPSERCEGSSQIGQCPYCKVDGSDYCPRHGGAIAESRKRKENLRNYQLTRWKARVCEFADNDGIKSLREEIGILRMVMETMLNQCHDATELLLYSTRMADLVMKIEKLVVSCDKMESKMGLLLSKDSVLQLAAEFVEIINKHVPDVNTIDVISMEMMQATLRMQNPVPNAPGTGGGNGTHIAVR